MKKLFVNKQTQAIYGCNGDGTIDLSNELPDFKVSDYVLLEEGDIYGIYGHKAQVALFETLLPNKKSEAVKDKRIKDLEDSLERCEYFMRLMYNGLPYDSYIATLAMKKANELLAARN